MNTEKLPQCGACKKEMTPLNSSIIPELFLCNSCAVEHGYGTPIQRINRKQISHLEIVLELISQPQIGMPELPEAWRTVLRNHLKAEISHKRLSEVIEAIQHKKETTT